jgi:hypothetical protein
VRASFDISRPGAAKAFARSAGTGQDRYERPKNSQPPGRERGSWGGLVRAFGVSQVPRCPTVDLEQRDILQQPPASFPSPIRPPRRRTRMHNSNMSPNDADNRSMPFRQTQRAWDSMQVSNVRGDSRLASQKRVRKRLMDAFNGRSWSITPQAS